MQFDSITLGARFLNVTAAIRDDMIQLNGTFIASADLIPVLLFSVGVPWVEPCVRHICCLWDVAERYRDHDLMAALVKRSGLTPVVEGLPAGVVAEQRTDGKTSTIFTFNFNGHEAAGLPAFGVKWDVKK